MEKIAIKKIIISLLTIAFAASLICIPLASAARYTSYILTVSYSEEGGTVTPGTSSYNYGDIVTVHAQANQGYAFQGWYLNGQFQGGLSSINITMFGSYWLEASFVKRSVTLTISVDPVQAGNTSLGPGVYSFSAGEIINILETPKPSCAFDGWFIDGSYLGTSENVTVIMNRDHILNAYFSPHDFNILSVTTSEGGYSNVTGTSVCSSDNQTVTVTAKPFDGFVFSYWIINHEFCIDNPVVVNVTSNQGLKAVFTQQGVTPTMPVLSAPPVTPKVTVAPTSDPTGNDDDDYQVETPKIDNSTWIEISLVAVIIVLISFIAVRSLSKSKENVLKHLDY
jgi:hypothetical protein